MSTPAFLYAIRVIIMSAFPIVNPVDVLLMLLGTATLSVMKMDDSATLDNLVHKSSSH
jgi:hypothetical protein